jgi:hypothetical protein
MGQDQKAEDSSHAGPKDWGHFRGKRNFPHMVEEKSEANAVNPIAFQNVDDFLEFLGHNT